MQNRVALGFGLVLAALLANAVVAGWNISRIRQNDRAVARSYAVLESLDRLLSTLQDAETGQRGYLLTGRPSYLEPYHDAVRNVRDRLAAVRALLPADEGPERVRALEADVNTKLEELEKTVALRDTEGPKAALAEVLTDRGQQAMDRLRASVEQARAQERDLLRRRADESHSSALLAFLSLTAAAVLGLALLGVAFYLVRRDRAGRERAAAERAALLARAESERAFLEAVLQQMPGGVLIAEAGTGRILLRNERGALPIPGGPPDPARLGDYAQFQGLFPDPRYPTFERWPLLRALTAGEVVTGEEMTYRRADGSLGTIRANAGPIRDKAGHVVAAITTFFDVTDARRAEDAVRFLAEAGAVLGASLDYEATLADLARLVVPRLADWCAVHVVDEDGASRQLAVAHADPAKVELAHDLNRRFPPDPDSATGVPAVLRTGQARMVAEITDEMLEKGARSAEHLAALRGLGLRSYMVVPLAARGRVVGAMTFVAAESGRRYGPDELALAEELGRRAGLAVDNARLYKEAREADRRKDDFLAVLSHELRNPLAPIRNAVAVLRLRGADAETVKWAREVIERQSMHLARLVDDLLDASRITRRKVRLRPERLDLAALVRATCEDHRGGLEGAGLALEVEAPPGPVWVEGDRTRLAQVLGNLLANAAKFTDRGGRVTVWLTSEDGHAEVAVRDTGVGVEPTMLPRLFEAFAQADRSLERSKGGLGLGLALVKGLVEMHGGEVRAASDGPGRGATFVFRLPLAVEGTAKAPAAQPAGAPARRRVLIVEDNRDAADSLRMLLELAGHEVAVAYTGAEGLKAARERRPDVVLCDLGLPGLSGFEVARALRQSAETAGVRLVAVSGYGRDEDQRRAREAGFDEVLVKPVSPAVLERLLA